MSGTSFRRLIFLSEGMFMSIIFKSSNGLNIQIKANHATSLSQKNIKHDVQKETISYRAHQTLTHLILNFYLFY